MGWNIGLIENSVKLSAAQAGKLVGNPEFLKVMERVYGLFGETENMSDADKIAEFFSKGGTARTPVYFLKFSPDHYEYMDYVRSVQSSLSAVKATGQICFGSLEGDNKNQFWGYHFDKGTFRKLSGVVEFYFDDSE